MNQKKIPPFIPWLAAGTVLFFCSYIPIRGNWETNLRICGISSWVAAFLWFFLPELMENHGQKIFGIWLVLAGLYLYFIGGNPRIAGMDGLFTIVLGIGFIIIT